MNVIELKKEEAAFYFNQAIMNLAGLDPFIAVRQQQMESKKIEIRDQVINEIISSEERLKKLENYIFNYKDIAKDAKNEIKCLLLKLVELRHFYSHYVSNETVRVLSKGEKPLLERYYQIAKESTQSENDKLALFEDENPPKLTNVGVLFLLCMFLKKTQTNNLIGGISGFKRTDNEARTRRNLFTYYCVREGYKIVPDMQWHFLLFALVNHLSNQDEYVDNIKPYDEIGQGKYFHMMASTFLNKSGITGRLKFYTYQSKRLDDQRGKIEPKEDEFKWVEPFQKNSYFSVNGQNGIISEDELKDLCYALLATKKFDSLKKIPEFLEKYTQTKNLQDIQKNGMLKKEYFPANYFAEPAAGSLKEKILSRLTSKKTSRKKIKAYDKMKEVMEFINNSLPADKKMKEKDYKRYLKMVRFWRSEKENIKHEFESKKEKGWSKCLSSDFWTTKDLAEAYSLAKRKNTSLLIKLKESIEKIDEKEFEKYQQINDAGNLPSLKKLAENFSLKWEEKGWSIYLKQVPKADPERQKLTIMKQRVTARLKEKHGIENLNLRITIDSNKSRKAVLNRIAMPRGFVRDHILGLQRSENISKKIRGAPCEILLSDSYGRLAKEFFDCRDWDKLTQINSLYEKNKIIAMMVLWLMEKPGISLDGATRLDELKKQKVCFDVTKKTRIRIPLSQYSSLAYVLSSGYADDIDSYKFSEQEKKEPLPFMKKVKIIEKERQDFIKEILDFEEYLFNNNIIDKSKFSNVVSHIGFGEICSELKNKGYNEEGLKKLQYVRNKALHGGIPCKTSFDEAKLLINEFKK
jgi:hypothetical protein